jgi:hypothetical protein
MWKFADFFDERGMAKKYWNSPWAGVPLWLTGAVFTVYWLYSVPPPGYAIGALAVVAGIMSVREIKILGKFSWVVLLVCLLITEFRAIDKDRADNEQKQKEFFEAQKTGFQGIATQADTNFKETAKGLEAAIIASQIQFNATMKRSDKVLDDLQENLGTLTGSESFAYLAFIPGQEYLVFVHQGKYPLYGVSARLVNLDYITAQNILGMTVPIGDLILGHANMQPLPAGNLQANGDHFNANIFFTARNGDWVQILREVRLKGSWVKAVQVQGRFTSLKNEKVMCETIDRDFPRSTDGKIDGFLVNSGPMPPHCQ